ncbi:formate dehydrogenase accessory sulfurtransferase FdhD [Williamsia sp. 1135]|uniref:formate dehydrogenase accessory sulfurtransferase FdhD n=1 Tax=Williamsia sp. 1135 TaxID=1889262 RepID=UPI000A104128|nr:formate dehydrogenase accessory sulfurtransferase FdhD [Williamsia sp. 1135]ORM37058.1 sulfurtransferase FdhD [Williamsia sp. 1135]
MGRVSSRTRVRRIRPGSTDSRADTLAVEEPLEIRIAGEALAVTMRTPGSDIDLTHGFLLTEGIISGADDISVIRYCDGVDDQGRNTYNVLDVAMREQHVIPETASRNFYATSSCGVCGKASLDAVRLKSDHRPADDPCTVEVGTLTSLPEQLRDAQKTFDLTGGVHGAALFRTDGTLLVAREDVGRHNAVDKVIGWAVQQRLLPLRETILMVSSRASFELAQKAVMAGIPILAAVSAPSSLAVDLGNETDLTIIGFLRGESMNVYSGGHRVRE